MLKYGSILDSAPVEKLSVNAAGLKTQFTGILRSISRSALDEEAFVTIAAGASYSTAIVAAAVHDLSAGGTYSVVAEGAIPYASNSTLTGAVAFKSNTIDISIDAAAAAKVKRAVQLNERTVLESDCSGSTLTSTKSALSYCKSLATAAATAASSGSSSKFSEYFGTTSTTTRAVVAARLKAVATECGSTTSGSTVNYCSDVYGYCESNVLAYTIPSEDVVVNCDLYYSALPIISDTCHDQDQATTTLHEYTHAPGVYSPGTADNGYGYDAATALSSAKAVLNADSYALYANG